jgi:hypothetical protein
MIFRSRGCFRWRIRRQFRSDWRRSLEDGGGRSTSRRRGCREMWSAAISRKTVAFHLGIDPAAMKTNASDQGTITKAGHIRLTLPCPQEDILGLRLRPGDWAWLGDIEVTVGAQLTINDRDGLAGVPDWGLVPPISLCPVARPGSSERPAPSARRSPCSLRGSRRRSPVPSRGGRTVRPYRNMHRARRGTRRRASS